MATVSVLLETEENSEKPQTWKPVIKSKFEPKTKCRALPLLQPASLVSFMRTAYPAHPSFI
jgi:hypothetical protein